MEKIKRLFYGSVGGKEGLFYKFIWEFIYLIKIWLNLPNRVLAKKRIKKYFLSHKKIKIQFGCGDNKLKDFLNTDLLGTIPIDITKRLPFKNKSVDVIYSSHTIEHIYNYQFKYFLKESFRILKPGGSQVISVPSIERVVKSIYFNNKMKKMLLNSRSYCKPGEKIDSATMINRIMHMWHMHKFLYDTECIQRLGKEAGFKEVFLSNKKNHVPDKTIQQNIKDKNFENDGVTETYVLIK